MTFTLFPSFESAADFPSCLLIPALSVHFSAVSEGFPAFISSILLILFLLRRGSLKIVDVGIVKEFTRLLIVTEGRAGIIEVKF